MLPKPNLQDAMVRGTLPSMVRSAVGVGLVGTLSWVEIRLEHIFKSLSIHM